MNKITKILISMIVITTIISDQVYANSSWHWVTTSPLTILPVAIIVTLLIEILGIKIFNTEFEIKKIVLVVTIANLVSFLAPYIERAYRFIPTTGGFSITSAFDKGPYYMILIGYLILTLIIEIPIVFILLKKESINRIRLILIIVIVNIITTGLVAVLERIACKGVW